VRALCRLLERVLGPAPIRPRRDGCLEPRHRKGTSPFHRGRSSHPDAEEAAVAARHFGFGGAGLGLGCVVPVMGVRAVGRVGLGLSGLPRVPGFRQPPGFRLGVIAMAPMRMMRAGPDSRRVRRGGESQEEGPEQGHQGVTKAMHREGVWRRAAERNQGLPGKPQPEPEPAGPL
jgi:hypothetical protein